MTVYSLQNTCQHFFLEAQIYTLYCVDFEKQMKWTNYNILYLRHSVINFQAKLILKETDGNYLM